MSSYYEDEDEIDIRVRRGGPAPPPQPPPSYPRSGFVERDNRAFRHVRPAPIYPARPVRRSSTLPVRFEDEETERVIEREVTYGRDRDDASRSRSRPAQIIINNRYEDADTEDEQLRDRLAGDDGITRERERVVIREREREPEYFEHGRRRSRSPSPIVIRNTFGRERSRSPDSSVDLDYERERSRRTSRAYRYAHSRDDYELERVRFDRDANDEDAGWEKDAYSFRLSRHTKSLLSRESTQSSISDASEDTESSPPDETRLKSPQPGTTLLVSQSKYTGDGSVGGVQSAEISLMSDVNLSSRKGAQPIFKWSQLTDSTMNFDRFETGCQSIAGLTDAQRTGITRVLGRVRRKADKPIQVSGGNKVRFMVPGILQEILPKEPGDSHVKTKTITWMCLPYFCLQKYAGNLSGLPASSHPVRTLLQARFSLTRKERDMQQAVRNLPGTLQDHCYHIAQVWCLILGDGKNPWPSSHSR